MMGHGMKASELVKQLQALIKKHGDQEVWVNSCDFPEGVAGVSVRTEPTDGYYRQGSFVVFGR